MVGGQYVAWEETEERSGDGIPSLSSLCPPRSVTMTVSFLFFFFFLLVSTPSHSLQLLTFYNTCDMIISLS
jgi:hypothetical protein